MRDIVPASSVTAKMRTEYMQCRDQVERSSQALSRYLRDHTQAERESLERAAEALEAKQAALLASGEARRKRQAHQQAVRRLQSVGYKVEDMQREAMRKIESMDVSLDEKRQLWSQVQAGIQTILHSDDELKALEEFKRQLAGMVGGPVRLLGS